MNTAKHNQIVSQKFSNFYKITNHVLRRVDTKKVLYSDVTSRASRGLA